VLPGPIRLEEQGDHMLDSFSLAIARALEPNLAEGFGSRSRYATFIPQKR